MSGWNGSDRRERLPANWPALRMQRLELDGFQCTWTLSISKERCPRRATDVDHKVEGSDDHRIGALQSLCREHHEKKTSIAARRIKYAKAQKRVRPAEGHPGQLS